MMLRDRLCNIADLQRRPSSSSLLVSQRRLRPVKRRRRSLSSHTRLLTNLQASWQSHQRLLFLLMAGLVFLDWRPLMLSIKRSAASVLWFLMWQSFIKWYFDFVAMPFCLLLGQTSTTQSFIKWYFSFVAMPFCLLLGQTGATLTPRAMVQVRNYHN